MTLFPTVLTLQNFRVHVHTTDSSNESSDIEILVDDCLGLCTILQIPDVDPNDSHVRFGRCFDNMRLRSQYNIIKNVKLFNNVLNNVGSNRGICLILKVRKSNDL